MQIEGTHLTHIGSPFVDVVNTIDVLGIRIGVVDTPN